eukprot:gene1614-2017_t
MSMRSFAVLLLSFILSWSGQAKDLRIVLAGDSTVATNLNPPKDRPTLAGWGQMLQEFMPRAEVINLARSGASSKSFRRLGLWDKVLAEKADY